MIQLQKLRPENFAAVVKKSLVKIAMDYNRDHALCETRSTIFYEIVYSATLHEVTNMSAYHTTAGGGWPKQLLSRVSVLYAYKVKNITL